MLFFCIYVEFIGYKFNPLTHHNHKSRTRLVYHRLINLKLISVAKTRIQFADFKSLYIFKNKYESLIYSFSLIQFNSCFFFNFLFKKSMIIIRSDGSVNFCIIITWFIIYGEKNINIRFVNV